MFKVFRFAELQGKEAFFSLLMKSKRDLVALGACLLMNILYVYEYIFVAILIQMIVLITPTPRTWCSRPLILIFLKEK